MNVKSILRKTFIKRIDNVFLLLKKPVQKINVEDFHQLRVEIKKLNALFKLVSFSAKKNGIKKLFNPLKLIFRQAGVIREIQLEEAELKKYAHYSGIKKYLKYLKKVQQKEKRKFSMLINSNLAPQLIKTKKQVLFLIEMIDKNDVKKYLNKKMHKIETLISKKHLKIKQVHEFRKRIKEFYYDRKNLNLASQSKVLKDVDYLQELLGRWHDLTVIKEHLKNAMMDKNVMVRTEFKQLKNVKTKLSSDSKVVYKKLNHTIYKGKFIKDFISISF